MVSFAPRLPEGLSRLAFSLFLRGRRLHVEVTHAEARYVLDDGEPLTVMHHGVHLDLKPDKPEVARSPPRRSAPGRPSRRAGNPPTAWVASSRSSQASLDWWAAGGQPAAPGPPARSGSTALPRRAAQARHGS